MNIKKRLSLFYILMIGISTILFLAFDFDFVFKAIIVGVILLCLCAIHCIKNAMIIPDDVDPDTMEKVPEITRDDKSKKDSSPSDSSAESTKLND